MIVATLRYQFAPGKVYRYRRTLTMRSTQADGSQLEGKVVSLQSWRLVEDREDILVMEVREELLQREGPLTADFQPPPAVRKAYLDFCGPLPEAAQEFTTLSNFPTLPEDPVDEGEGWHNTEFVPNWPSPVEVSYRFVDSQEWDQQFAARLSFQAQERSEESALELEGQCLFAVAAGLPFSSRLILTHHLPAGELVSLQVDLDLQK